MGNLQDSVRWKWNRTRRTMANRRARRVTRPNLLWIKLCGSQRIRAEQGDTTNLSSHELQYDIASMSSNTLPPHALEVWPF